MALKVTRDDIRTGANFDEGFCKRHLCGECGARITHAFKDGDYWLRCTKVWEHDTFERIPGYVESWRRGENAMLESTRGAYEPHKTRHWRHRGTKRTTIKP